MKKSIIHILILTVLITSCGKTIKSKVINDWKVTSYVENYSLTDEYGDQTTGSVSIDENNFNMTEDVSQGFDHTWTGTTSKFSYTIKKDGTWSSESDVTYGLSPNTTSEHVTKKTSGTWSFVGKTKGDDFKKNERIVFNTLYKSEVHVQEDEPDDPQIIVWTYLTGEKTTTYTIKESKAKKLQLESEQNSTLIYYQNPHIELRKINITLEQK